MLTVIPTKYVIIMIIVIIKIRITIKIETFDYFTTFIVPNVVVFVKAQNWNCNSIKYWKKIKCFCL